MLPPKRAEAVARAWVEAWNRRDLAAILEHYAEDVVFTSPVVAQRLGRADGTLRGKAELATYFRGGLDANPDLRFDLLGWTRGVDSVAVRYRNHRGLETVEVMHLDDFGKVRRGVVHYGPA